jgi:Leucine-rich repeat (LRR) protein
MEAVDEFFDEVKKVSSLKILKLMGYGLENFNVTWKSVFNNLTSLSLASNDLTSISPGVFDSATELVSLDLSNNLLADLNITFEALLPLTYTLKELRLNGNSIDKLIEFPDFENLEILDLSNNKLTELNGTYFGKLTRLSHLYLSENKLQTVEESVFDEQKNLMVLLLNNNYLTQIPNIENLLRLQILDISNQNKQLTKIKNYAFQRNEMPSNSLFINLVANQINEFDDKAFCSTYSNVTEIGGMDISFESLENVSICILKQLRSTMTPKITLKIVEPIGKSSTNLTHVCNCHLKQVSLKNKINLTGICGYISDECDGEQENVDEFCSEYERKFDCNE